MGTERRRFTEEFKRNAVELELSAEDRLKAEVARELGIRPGLLYRWLEESHKEEGGGPKVFVGQGNPRDEELYRLRKENADLRETNEIPKKRRPSFCRKDLGNGVRVYAPT